MRAHRGWVMSRKGSEVCKGDGGLSVEIIRFHLEGLKPSQKMVIC